MLLEKSGETTTERMKRWTQRKTMPSCGFDWNCIGTWNVRSMNQSKLEVIKQEMERVNINILGISEQNGPEWLNLIQMTIISITVGKNA